jgi:hypothetical protein
MHHRHSKLNTTKTNIILVFIALALLIGVLIPLGAYLTLIGM